jgi:anaerobic carbon-monoxide dehydrogenase iron sulfur subunit
MRISIDNQKCVACFSCTLACSFHHTRAFSPQEASIRILMDDSGVVNADVLPTCDLCPKERIPLCIEFCPVNAIKKEK